MIARRVPVSDRTQEAGRGRNGDLVRASRTPSWSEAIQSSAHVRRKVVSGHYKMQSETSA
jgi:hypothetical protein